jgi:protein import protein ZIM17
MLPSRLFRNTGLPPALRSLLIPSPSLPSTYNVQLRFRLGITVPALAAPQRSRYSTASSSSSSPPSSSSSNTLNLGGGEKTTAQETEQTPVAGRQALGKIEPKLSITFTCTVEGCGRRSTHEFTKHAYEKGIVLIQCPGCKNRYIKFRPNY